MASFTIEIPDLRVDGPLVEVHLAVGDATEAALRAANSSVPPPVAVQAMVDTGATKSVMQQGVAIQLGLNPVSMTSITTPSSTNVLCPEYLIRLVFPNNVLYEGTVIEAPLQGQSVQCLIGRDVLSHAVFVYIGYRNLFSLSF